MLDDGAQQKGVEVVRYVAEDCLVSMYPGERVDCAERTALFEHALPPAKFKHMSRLQMFSESAGCLLDSPVA